MEEVVGLVEPESAIQPHAVIARVAVASQQSWVAGPRHRRGARRVEVGEVAEKRRRAQPQQVGAARVGAVSVEDSDGVERRAVMMELTLVAYGGLAVDDVIPIPPRLHGCACEDGTRRHTDSMRIPHRAQ